MCEGGRDVGVLNGSEVSEPPEVKSGVWERRIWEGEVTRSGRQGVIGRAAHCGASSEEREGRDEQLLTQFSEG